MLYCSWKTSCPCFSDDYLCEITNQRQSIYSINGNAKSGRQEPLDSQSEPVMTDKDLVMALTEIVSSSNSKLENLTVKACWSPVFKKILRIQNVTLTESLAQRYLCKCFTFVILNSFTREMKPLLIKSLLLRF